MNHEQRGKNILSSITCNEEFVIVTTSHNHRNNSHALGRFELEHEGCHENNTGFS